MITPNGNRLHVGIYGRCNSGKSTIFNLIVGQNVALVSSQAGTTTDPVYKAMEINGIGAVTLIDTAGYDDTTSLGTLRTSATVKTLAKVDIAVLVYRGELELIDNEWIECFDSLELPYILVNNADDANFASKDNSIIVNGIGNTGKSNLIAKLVEIAVNIGESSKLITDGYVNFGETVILVMPQDGSAPKGRLILPQTQVIRELLDRGCIAICTIPERYSLVLDGLKEYPSLVITDSQVFDIVYGLTPKGVALTSFSVLFAEQKGDITTFIRGAKTISELTPSSHVLIAEACSHAPQSEDIGRVKIPNILKAKYGVTHVDICAGSDFPEDLSGYDLIIHCGACMFNRRHVMSRIALAKGQNVSITNYGIAIAELKGILGKITIKDNS